MEDSAFQAIYTGVYIVIFLAALTTTLYLFNGINDLADKSYEFGKQSTGNGLVEMQDISTLTLSKSDLIAYYMNYVKNDKYELGQNKEFGTVSFEEVIPGYNSNNLTYSELISKLSDIEYEIKITGENSAKFIKKQ